MKFGDFTELAKNYSLYRPAYSPFVLEILKSLAKGRQCADIGAGTGIWSRQLAASGFKVVTIEPNEAMRSEGMAQSGGFNLKWLNGSAEHTGLESECYDVVCMASSFHWTDFDLAIKEFFRILKPGGIFMALWNTRVLENNPLLLKIENYLKRLVPELKRISSGRSEFCENLTENLRARKEFADVAYIEGHHKEIQTPERYIGLWKSVNDVRVQAGEERFKNFIQFIKTETANQPYINAEYLTRAWIARRRD